MNQRMMKGKSSSEYAVVIILIYTFHLRRMIIQELIFKLKIQLIKLMQYQLKKRWRGFIGNLLIRLVKI